MWSPFLLTCSLGIRQQPQDDEPLAEYAQVVVGALVGAMSRDACPAPRVRASATSALQNALGFCEAFFKEKVVRWKGFQKARWGLCFFPSRVELCGLIIAYTLKPHDGLL